jgi:hypothetical protein
MMTIVTHVHLRDGTERDWDAAMRTRLAAARKASGWVGGQLLRPADKPDRRVIVGGGPVRTGRHGTMIRNSRRRASGSTGWRARPPSTGGTTSCSMSGKPRRRPRQPPSLQTIGGRRARRRAHEGALLDDPANAAPTGRPGDSSEPAVTAFRLTERLASRGSPGTPVIAAVRGWRPTTSWRLLLIAVLLAIAFALLIAILAT